MHEIILRQHDAARKLDGKGFVLGIAGILLKLSIAQIICNWLIRRLAFDHVHARYGGKLCLYAQGGYARA